MPTRRIHQPSEWKNANRRVVCTHPEHNPPAYQVFKSGTYEHTCPCCSKTTTFNVPEVRY